MVRKLESNSYNSFQPTHVIVVCLKLANVNHNIFNGFQRLQTTLYWSRTKSKIDFAKTTIRRISLRYVLWPAEGNRRNKKKTKDNVVEDVPTQATLFAYKRWILISNAELLLLLLLLLLEPYYWTKADEPHFISFLFFLEFILNVAIFDISGQCFV